MGAGSQALVEEMRTSEVPLTLLPFAAAGALTCLIDLARLMVGSPAAAPLLCQPQPCISEIHSSHATPGAFVCLHHVLDIEMANLRS